MYDFLNAAIEVLPDIKIDNKTLLQLKEEFKEETQVIVHCTFTNRNDLGDLIRIWPTTYLVAKNGNHKSELLHSENIILFPHWQIVKPNTTTVFTLIFSALPKDCEVFDFMEEIPEPGAFCFTNIKRNKTDVYNIRLA